MSSALLEFENGTFFESVAEAARQRRRHPMLGRLAMAAANAALMEPARDGEGEWEASSPSLESFESNESAPSALLMEHLAHAASEAESDGEAFAFLAPLVPMAMKALPMALKAGSKLAAKLLPRVAPKLIKGVNGVAKTLRSSPSTKPLVQAIPRVVQQATADIARQASSGIPIDEDAALQTFARDVAKMLGDANVVMQILARAKQFDRRFHAGMSSVRNMKACTCQQQ